MFSGAFTRRRDSSVLRETPRLHSWKKCIFFLTLAAIKIKITGWSLDRSARELLEDSKSPKGVLSIDDPLLTHERA
jgi:hypothetical protein